MEEGLSAKPLLDNSAMSDAGTAASTVVPPQNAFTSSTYRPNNSSVSRSVSRQQSVKIDPKALGASGMPSITRSTVTKSFNRSAQGGFDYEGDNDKGVEQLVRVGSARPGSMAAVIASMGTSDPMTDEYGVDEEDVSYCCGCFCGSWNGVPITNNTKALFVMMMLFALISLAQYFAADAVKSQALKADVISMAVDALSYLGNILGESAVHPAQRVVTQLFFSMISVVLLVYFNSTTFVESLALLDEVNSPDYENTDAVSSEGVVVITFAGLGLLFDFVCLYAYYAFAKKDAEKEFQAMQAQLAVSQQDGAEAAKIKKPKINMLSALLHVSADLFRSTSTFVLGVLMVSGTLDQREQDQGDAILALIIGGTIYVASVYALYEWWGCFSDWFASLAFLEMEEGEKEGVGNILLG